MSLPHIVRVSRESFKIIEYVIIVHQKYFKFLIIIDRAVIDFVSYDFIV